MNTTNATPEVQLCQDGKYRWVYEMSLYKNPTILLLLLKIFGWIVLGLWVFLNLLQACDSVNTTSFMESLWTNTKIMLVCGAVIGALCVVGYYLYALIMGGKYCVLFEMDDQGVMHKQMANQVKKSQLIGAITTLAGVATGNPATAALGMNAAVRTEMYSTFDKVSSLNAVPHRNLINIHEGLFHNHVYAAANDFSFVIHYIHNQVRPEVRNKFH